MPVQMNLLGLPGTDLADVRQVLSIPVASAQCRDWLLAHAPQATVVASRQAPAAKLDGIRALGAETRQYPTIQEAFNVALTRMRACRRWVPSSAPRRLERRLVASRGPSRRHAGAQHVNLAELVRRQSAVAQQHALAFVCG